MDILQDPYVIFARKVTSFFGFWPFQPYEERFFRSWIVGFCLMYGVLVQVYQLLILDLNLRSTILILQLFIPFICVTNLYLTSLVNFATVNELFSWWIKDCLELEDDIELEIMERHVNENRLYPRLWGVLSVIYIGTSMIQSCLQLIPSTNKVSNSVNRYPIFSCFDHFIKQTYYYYFIVIYQTLTVIIMALVGIAIYCGYFCFIQHTCARLSIVKNRLHRPFINCNENSNVLAIPNDHSYWIIDIIEHLNRTAQYMAMVNKLGEKTCLFQMSTVFLAFIINFVCIFQIPSLLKNRKDWNDAIAFISFVLGSIIPAYINVYVGQRLMDYSAEVYRETCLVPIHEVSLKTQKLLLITLMMNTKPCTVSIGKMFVLSHEFFSDLLRSSLSFGMVLRSIQNM